MFTTLVNTELREKSRHVMARSTTPATARKGFALLGLVTTPLPDWSGNTTATNM